MAAAPNGDIVFALTIDDHDVAYALAMASVVEADSGHLSFFVNAASITAPEQADLVTLATAGHEVGNHAWSHTALTNTTAFTVTSTNTNPTVDVDVATSTLALSCDEVPNRVTVDWSVTDKSVADLKTAVSGKGWTITNSTQSQDLLKLSSLADTAGAQSVPETMALDLQAFWNEEIDDTQAWLAALLGAAPTTLAWPYGLTSETLQNYVKDAGLLGARGITGATQTLDLLRLFQTLTVPITTVLGDGTEATVRANMRTLISAPRPAGTLVSFYVHSAAELSTTQAGWMTDELTLAGYQWQTFGSIVATIRASHTSQDGLVWTNP